MHRRKNRGDTGELRVEVAGIGGVADGRQEWWGHTLVVDVVPVDVPEESMRHDFLGIRWSRTKTQLRLTGEQLLKDRNRVARHVNWVQRLISENGVVDFIFVFTTEGRLLKEHLVDEDTERPPVNSAAVFLIQENLVRGQ